MRRLWCCAATLLGVLACPAVAAAEWLELRTANFLFLGDVPERELRDTARSLEQFRELLARITPGLPSASPVPTVVIMFANARAFAPFQPVRDGRRAAGVGGYFQPGDTVNYIALNAGGRDSAVRVVFHEYVHALLSNTVGEAPGWLNEGLAQVYETAQISDEGSSAVIGAALVQHVVLLLERGSAISLDRLMRPAQSIELLHDGLASGAFYAESWALLHYLLLANPDRASQLRDYTGRLAAGESQQAAFDAVFRPDLQRLEQELTGYVTQMRLIGRRYTFTDPVAPVETPRARDVSDDQAEPYLADLLAHMGRTEEARARLRQLLERQPDNARAAAALGSIELRALRFDEALVLLERAAALAPDDAAIQGALGAALYEAGLRSSSNRTVAADTFARAQRALDHAVALAPGVAPALVSLAHVELARGGDANRARELLEKAVALAPSRREYQRALRDVIDGMATSPRSDPSSGVTGLATRFALRVPQPGEQRVAGRFVRLECSARILQYHIATDAGVLRLDALLTGVQVISYVPTPSSFGCGAVPGAPSVLATYIPVPAQVSGQGATRDGDVVAIEIVPEGYRP
jgi:tetratricopeptide (TPR) repeat protein